MIVAALLACGYADARVRFSDDYAFLFAGLGAGLLGSAILLFAMIALTVGRPGAAGIAGESISGRVALVTFGCSELARQLLGIAGSTELVAPWPLTSVVFDGVVLLSLVVSAVSVVKAGVLEGVTRWVWCLVATCWCLVVLLSAVVGPVVSRAVFAEPMALAVAGAVLLAYGRETEIRERLDAIRRAW